MKFNRLDRSGRSRVPSAHRSSSSCRSPGEEPAREDRPSKAPSRGSRATPARVVVPSAKGREDAPWSFGAGLGTELVLGMLPRSAMGYRGYFDVQRSLSVRSPSARERRLHSQVRSSQARRRPPAGAPVERVLVPSASFVLRTDGTLSSWGGEPSARSRVVALARSDSGARRAHRRFVRRRRGGQRMRRRAGVGVCWGTTLQKLGSLTNALPRRIDVPEPVAGVATTTGTYGLAGSAGGGAAAPSLAPATSIAGTRASRSCLAPLRGVNGRRRPRGASRCRRP